MATVHLPIRQLVEFLLRTGSIDSRFTGFDRALEGAHIHRKLQKAAGDGYQAEVFLSVERQAEDITFTLEGRADGIFTDETGTVVIDEIKTTAVPPEEITEDMNPCHWAQGMVYGAIYAAQQSLPELNVRLTYYQIDTDQIIRFIRRFTQQELDEFLDKLLCQYAPWAQRRIEWDVKRTQSLAALQFPFAQYRPGQRAMAGEIYRACRAGKTADCKGGTRLFCQAPTGIGKTMSALFPALKAMGEGNGEKLFYLTARNTTQTAAEDALTRLHTAQPELALRSVTLTAKEKVCLHPDAEGHPACLPELCPYANGYYDRIKDALTALLDGTGSFDRAALAGAAKRFSVCPFELGLDLSDLDPAPFVDASLTAGRSAALFSATLAPPSFYRSVLGCSDARAVALDSPFPAENLGLYCLPNISTRYRDREASVQAVSDALAQLVQARTGNYFAFFPSYAYLRQVHEDFAARYPGIRTLVQESRLDDAARAEFLAQFVPDPAETLLGFGVMGGIFGEGVDLAGSRLIGCAIVGVGLPQVNPQQEMLRRYYDAQNGSGFDYAYRYPGMNKVLQAAGRVIRTPEDRGAVLLLDDRFAQQEYIRLFPPHWRHIRYLRSCEELAAALQDFWNK